MDVTDESLQATGRQNTDHTMGDNSPPPTASLSDDGDYNAPMPDATRMAAEAVALAGDDADLARSGRALLAVRAGRGAGRSDARRRWSTAAKAHRELAAQRVPGRAEAGHQDSAETATRRSSQIVTDDMPFLVDSVNSALIARGLDVHLLIHPLIVVRREPLGALVEVHAGRRGRRRRCPASSWRAGCTSRSTGSASRTLVDELRRDLIRVLTDVREAVEDWPKMRVPGSGDRRRAGQRARFRCPTRTSPTASSCCAGSADDHFTFLGYREYKLEHEPGRRAGAGRRAWAPASASCARTRPAPRPLSHDDAGGVRGGDGEAAADHHQGQLAVDRAPQRLPRLHRLQDVRRGRQRGRREALPRPVRLGGVSALGQATCRWSSARWPRSSSAPACPRAATPARI